MNSVLRHSNFVPVIPEVDMGATEILHSDRHAFTVVKVISPKLIIVQLDAARRVDNNGMSENQTYEFSRSKTAPTYEISLRKNGKWIQVGQSMNSGIFFLLGYRDEYHDFSF